MITLKACQKKNFYSVAEQETQSCQELKKLYSWVFSNHLAVLVNTFSLSSQDEMETKIRGIILFLLYCRGQMCKFFLSLWFLLI